MIDQEPPTVIVDGHQITHRSTPPDQPALLPPSDHQASIQPILPNLFIGDLNVARCLPTLQSHKIRNVVSVMKQSYPHHPHFDYLLVPVDDDDHTNISEWFDLVARWIQDRLDDPNPHAVLIHCLAGVSRSCTLLAAYLMKARKLTADQALKLISSQRPQVQPNESFIHQLEMYERCNFEWNPAQYQEQRRFIMNFVASEMKDGVGPQKLILAYYPSPAPSPVEASGLTMTPLRSTLGESQAHQSHDLGHSDLDLNPLKLTDQPTRRRFTKKAELKSCHGVPKHRPKQHEPVLEKLGQGQVVIRGRRIRCKMCRRELAARDHILVHSPGKGQSAFAPQKQDMARVRQGLVEEKACSGLPKDHRSSPLDARDDRDDRDRSSTGEGGRVGLRNLRISLPPTHPSFIRPIHPDIEGRAESEEDPDDHNESVGCRSSGLVRWTTIQSPPLNLSKECSSYFVEPLSWMGQVLQRGEMMGRLTCPNSKCQAKLGSFDWAGSQCSCGAWITPGFQILKSKVDEV